MGRRKARGDSSTARALLDRSIEAQRQGARYAAAVAIYRLTVAAYSTTRPPTRTLRTRSPPRAWPGSRRPATRWGVGFREATWWRQRCRGRPVLEHAERALAEARAVHQPTLEAVALYAKAFRTRGQPPLQRGELLHESLTLMRRLGIELERDRRPRPAHGARVATRRTAVVRPGATMLEQDSATHHVMGLNRSRSTWARRRSTGSGTSSPGAIRCCWRPWGTRNRFRPPRTNSRFRRRWSTRRRGLPATRCGGCGDSPASGVHVDQSCRATRCSRTGRPPEYVRRPRHDHGAQRHQDRERCPHRR